MAYVYFDSAEEFIDSVTDVKDKIEKLDAIIDSLFTTALKAAGKNHIEEYMLNDGQTIIKTRYTGAEAVQGSIKAFEQIRQMYINRVNGRVTQLVDGKNFR